MGEFSIRAISSIIVCLLVISLFKESKYIIGIFSLIIFVTVVLIIGDLSGLIDISYQKSGFIDIDYQNN